MYVGNTHRNWDCLVDFMQLAINSTKSETTGYSPYYLNHGFNATLPWECLDAPGKIPANPNSVSPYVQTILDSRDHVQSCAKRAQLKQGKYYNKKRTDVTFGKNVLVLRKAHRQSNAQLGVSKKLFKKWEGPYRIADKLGNLTYMLVDPGSNKLAGTWHISQLKLYHPRSPDHSPSDDLPEVHVSPSQSVCAGKTLVLQKNALADPFHLPFKYGWLREMVVRKKKRGGDDNQIDVYYYSPTGKPYRSIMSLHKTLVDTKLSQHNFCFDPHPVYREPEEIIRTTRDPSVRQLHSHSN